MEALLDPEFGAVLEIRRNRNRLPVRPERNPVHRPTNRGPIIHRRQWQYNYLIGQSPGFTRHKASICDTGVPDIPAPAGAFLRQHSLLPGRHRQKNGKNQPRQGK